MIIDNICFSLSFERIQNFRQQILDIEKKLGDHFITPLNILPIPDDAPPEIPRIIARSKQNHTELIVSSNHLQISTKFDDNYNKKIDKCFEYMVNIINTTINSFSFFLDDKFLCAGIVSRIISTQEDPMKFLEEKFINIKSNKEPFNFTEKVVYVIDDKYYVNFQIFNLRTYEGKVNANNRPILSQSKHNLCIEIDINDKYGFNNDEKHICNENTIIDITNKAKQSININIEKILKGECLEL